MAVGQISTELYHGVSDARQDFAIRLVAYEPDGPMLGVMPEPIDVKVTYPLSDLPALQFEYRKDAPGAEWITRPAGLEVATELYIPRTGRWVEPMQGRFVVLDWEEDVVDPASLIKVTAPGYGWLLSKVVVHKRLQDDRLRAAEARAIAAETEAKRDLDQAQRGFNAVVTRARNEWRMRGNQFRLNKYPFRHHGKPIINRSLLFHTRHRKFYWYNASAGKWYLCERSSNLHSEANTEYNKFNSANNAYIAAKRAADRARNAAREVSKNQKRPMLKVTAGAVMGRLFTEAKARARGRLAGMSPGFNGTYSSAYNGLTVPGAPSARARRKWSRQFNIDLTLGQSYLDVLNSLTEMGEVEWLFHKRQLRLFRPGDLGVKLTRHVGLNIGTDMTEAPDRVSRRDFANYVHVRGEGHKSTGVWNNEKTIATGWGVWEKSIAVSGIDNTPEMVKAALKEARNSLLRLKVESTREIALGSRGDYRPMYDYLPGQYIMAYASDGQLHQYRVMSVTLNFNSDQSVTGNIVMGDKFMQTALDFRKTIARTVGGYERVIGGGTVPLLPAPPTSLPDEEQALLPAPVLAATARAGVNTLTGQPATLLTLAWQSVEDPSTIEPLPEAEEPGEFEEAPEGMGE